MWKLDSSSTQKHTKQIPLLFIFLSDIFRPVSWLSRNQNWWCRYCQCLAKEFSAFGTAARLVVYVTPAATLTVAAPWLHSTLDMFFNGLAECPQWMKKPSLAAVTLISNTAHMLMIVKGAFWTAKTKFPMLQKWLQAFSFQRSNNYNAANCKLPPS